MSDRPPTQRAPVAGSPRRPRSSRAHAGAHALRIALQAHVDKDCQSATRILEEFWIPLSNERADLVVVNGSLASYEIKSAKDRLDRLARQVDAYSRIFDECTLVVAERHFERALDVVPPWWGLMVTADVEPISIVSVRDPMANVSVNPESLVRLLWRAEVFAALMDVSEAPPTPTDSRARLWRRLVEQCDLSQLRRIVREALLARPLDAGRIPTRRALLHASAPSVSKEDTCSTTTAR